MKFSLIYNIGGGGEGLAGLALASISDQFGPGTPPVTGSKRSKVPGFQADSIREAEREKALANSATNFNV